MTKQIKDGPVEAHEEAPNEFLIPRRVALMGLLGTVLTPVTGLLSPALAQSTLKQAAEIGDVLGNIPNMCRVATATIEGPYYIDKEIVRSDISEDQPGVPLELELRLVNANGGCAPIAGAVVSIWHCNADGEYSGYLSNDPSKMPEVPAAGESGHVQQQGTERFLRGAQTTDADGKVTFRTIFPGWYTPRAVHIHARAFLNESAMITSQLYLPQAVINPTIQRRIPKKHVEPPSTHERERHSYPGRRHPESLRKGRRLAIRDDHSGCRVRLITAE